MLGRALVGLALELSPRLFAILCFAAGGVMLTSAVTPVFADRLEMLNQLMPPVLIDLSHFAASLTGFLLLLLSAGLWRRRRGAWAAAVVVLVLGALFSLAKGLDWEEALELMAVAAVLAPCRNAFDRKSRLFESLSPTWIGLVMAVVGASVWLGFFAYRNVDYTDELWWSFIRDDQVSGFLRGGALISILALALAARALLSVPGLKTHGPAGTGDREKALVVLQAQEGVSPDGWLALLGDKALLFSPSARSFLTYRVYGRRWIAMGGPVGPREEHQPLLWAFAEMADSYGGAPVFYAAAEDDLADLATLGLAMRKVGEAALVDPGSFSLEGKSRQNLRTAVNRAEREGATFEMALPGHWADWDDLRAVSDAWLAMHKGSEKSFSLGRFDPAFLTHCPLAVVRTEGRIVAFVSLMSGEGRLAVDLMRHVADAPPGVMDFLFVRLILWARETGAGAIDLGMAPLAGLENRRLAPVFARVGALVFQEGGALYGFQGLRAYKSKFSPDWRPRFIAAPSSTPLPLALLDVALLTSGGWPGLLGFKRP